MASSHQSSPGDWLQHSLRTTDVEMHFRTTECFTENQITYTFMWITLIGYSFLLNTCLRLSGLKQPVSGYPVWSSSGFDWERGEERVAPGRWGSKAWVGLWHPAGFAGLEGSLALLDKTVQGATENCSLRWIDPKMAFVPSYFSWEVKYCPRFHSSCNVF